MKRVLLGELTDLTEEEVEELAQEVVNAIDLDHEIIEDESDFPDPDSDDDDDDDFIADEMAYDED